MEYEQFLKKFTTDPTTDDCITPEPIYNAVRDFFVKKYGLENKKIVRPFWYGNDYKELALGYDEDTVVIDNPPFSLTKEILKFYNERGVKFVIFCPGLTATWYAKENTVYLLKESLTYENKAKVKSGFVTNLDESGAAFILSRELNRKLKKTDEECRNYKAKRKNTNFPRNLLSAAKLCKFADIDAAIPREACEFVRNYDGRSIFGCGFYVPDEIVDMLEELKAGADE